MGYNVVVAGASGNVGQEMLNILAERQFPINKITALASRNSIGREVEFGEKTLKCNNLENFDFSDTDVALFAVGSDATKVYAPRAAKAGSVVIDNSSLYRYDDDVPLIVPEVNADSIVDFRAHNIIANPNCSTAQLVVALKPLHDLVPIQRVIVSTYQSVSGSGRKGMDELWEQTRAVYTISKYGKSEVYPKEIAFNVIPHIDTFVEHDETREEWKMRVEIKKILDQSIELSATCVRVPVFIGHSEAVNVEFTSAYDLAAVKEALGQAPGIIIEDKTKDGGYITPKDCVSEDATFISRIRRDLSCENGLNFWCVSDNLRKGAALNAVQIAECLINRQLIGPRPNV